MIGVIYSLIGVRSPAPPIVALIGLLGILAGESTTTYTKRKILQNRYKVQTEEGLVKKQKKLT